MRGLRRVRYTQGIDFANPNGSSLLIDNVDYTPQLVDALAAIRAGEYAP